MRFRLAFSLPPFAFAPILFNLTCSTWGRWIFALEPLTRAARTIGRVFALRHNALASEQAGVLECKPPVMLEDLIDAGGRSTGLSRQSPTKSGNERRRHNMSIPWNTHQPESSRKSTGYCAGRLRHFGWYRFIPLIRVSRRAEGLGTQTEPAAFSQLPQEEKALKSRGRSALEGFMGTRPMRRAPFSRRAD